MIDDIKVCYKLLEIEPGCTLEELKRSRKELVQVWHPDRFSNDKRLQIKAEERVKQINAAYDTLLPVVSQSVQSPHQTDQSAEFSQPVQQEFFNRPFSKIDGDEVKGISFSRRHLGIWTIVLAAFLGLIASILIITSRGDKGVSEYEELITYDAEARKNAVILQDANDLFRYQAGQHIQQKLGSLLERLVGTNRFRTKVELEVEPESKVILLLRVSVLVDGDGQYDRDNQGRIIGDFQFIPCSSACLDNIRTQTSNVTGIQKSRGDAIYVYCTDFSKSVYVHLNKK